MEKYLPVMEKYLVVMEKFLPENILQHQGILEAALDRDEDLLRRLIHDHLSRNLAQPLPEKKSR